MITSGTDNLPLNFRGTMFGILRFLLALMVCFNHMPRQTFPFELAIVAVVIFYMLSGYTMGLKFTNLKKKYVNPIKIFLVDRAVRVFPLYLAVVFITLIVVQYYGSSELISFAASAKNIIGNFLLIPTNYYYKFNLELLIPPSYSLALEEQFYLLMPFLLYYNKYVLAVIVGLLSFIGCIYLTFVGKDPRYYADIYIYRNLIPVLPIFFLGISMGKNVLEKNIFKFIYAFLIVCFLFTFLMGLHNIGHFFSVLIGVIVGVPVISYLKDLPRNDLDDKIGLIAYPIFLCHFLVYFVLEKHKVMDFLQNKLGIGTALQINTNILIYRIIASTVTILLACFLVLIIEIPLHKLRTKVSKKMGILK